MSPFEIAMLGLAALVFIYGAFGLLVLEMKQGYRDIRLALEINKADRDALPELPKTATVQRWHHSPGDPTARHGSYKAQ